MTPFVYARAGSTAEAVAILAANPSARIIAGGTNLLDLMKEGTERPSQLIDITRIDALRQIEEAPGGGLIIGALVSNSELADDERVRERFPLVAQALLAGASPQLRNAATLGGNILQRTRCYYFTDPTTPCNKRISGEGCSAREGLHAIHAIFGWSDACIATHPSDMAVAMVAHDALVHIEGPGGNRSLALADLQRLPGDAPERDTVLTRDELIVAVELPASLFGQRVHYLKVRERSSYAFATVSVAAAIRLDAGLIVDARVVLGGVAHKPWRSAPA
jgi:xanthine dehydrogenase YagS FAD-binding subunit